jgi:DNA modification methylase
VWEIGQAGEDHGLHPTMKPLEIFTRPISWHTRKGEVVLEPFSGSGTQVIAAEQLERRCYAMELSPGFVDAAIGRFEKATGKKAILEESGLPFEQVAESRD